MLLDLFALNMKKQLTQKDINGVSKVVWETLKRTHIVDESLKDDSNCEELYTPPKSPWKLSSTIMNLKVHHLSWPILSSQR